MQPTCYIPDDKGNFAKQIARPPDLPAATNCCFLRFSSFSGRLWPDAAKIARFLLAIVFTILILCSLSASEPSERPETGTYIRDMDRDGYGILAIYNNWTQDTVAVLTDRWDKPKVAVYLRAKDAYEIDGLKDGEYNLYFTIGNGWNSSEGKFEDVYGYYHYNDPMIFETNDLGDEIEYTILELDLYKADATNFVPGQFQFPNIGS